MHVTVPRLARTWIAALETGNGLYPGGEDYASYKTNCKLTGQALIVSSSLDCIGIAVSWMALRICSLEQCICWILVLETAISL